MTWMPMHMLYIPTFWDLQAVVLIEFVFAMSRAPPRLGEIYIS